MSRSSLPGLVLAVMIGVGASACGGSENPLSPSRDYSSAAPATMAPESPADDDRVAEPEPATVGPVTPEPVPEPEPEPEPEPAATSPEPEPVATPDPDPPSPPAESDAVPEPPPPAPEPEPTSPPPAPDPPPPPPDPEPAPPEPEPAPPPPPPEPDPPPPDPDPPAEPVAPTGLTVVYEPSLSSPDIRLSWNPAPEGSYLVELGSSPGATNRGSFQVNATSFAYGALPPGRVFARVRTVIGHAASDPSNEVDVHYFDFKDYIEAIFLGSGPLTPTNGNRGCPYPGTLSGFSPGVVEVILSTAMPPSRLAWVERVAGQASNATAGVIQTIVSHTEEEVPMPGQGQVTVTGLQDPRTEGCGFTGCTIHKLNEWSRAIVNWGAPREGYAHEVGHAVVGFCHIDGNLIGGAHLSMMSAGPGIWTNHHADELTPYDLAASRAVYQAGLRAGQGRSAFVAAGLINP